MFSVGLSPSSNQRRSQANRVDGPVPTVNEVVKWGALQCYGSLRSSVGPLWSGLCDHSDVFKKEHSNAEQSKTVQSVSIYACLPKLANRAQICLCEFAV